MKFALSTRFIALVVGLLLACGSPAQQAEDTAEPVAPDLNNLQSDWWAYFDDSRDTVEPRLDDFLNIVAEQIAALAPQNQEAAQSVLDAVRDNFAVLLTLLDDPEIVPQELPPAAIDYSIDSLLKLAATAREARAKAAEEEQEVVREERVLAGASRRRDAAFNDYVAAADGDEKRTVALRLLQARTAQAISARRLELLTQRFERATVYADATAERVEVARERLATNADEEKLAELAERVDAARSNVEDAREKVRAAQIAASGLDVDTDEGRSQQRLQQERLLDAEVELALAEAALAQAEAMQLWTEFKLGRGPDAGIVGDKVLEWSGFVRQIAQRAPDWQRETEDELLAAQAANRDGLDRTARRLLDQRAGTAQEALTHLGDLEVAVADLALLMTAVDDASAESAGAFKSWLATLNRTVKGAYQRVAGLGDETLFSVGETPVAGDDILRVIIILVVAWLLSRGVRVAIRRFGASESAGTQASLYTVGRLTHYTIIILAVFIALSSIGLNFRNLALVAGALSVGIGFGLQSIVNNFVSGLIILFEHTLRVGDYIELDTGLTGTVKSINVRSTLINTNDNIDIVVPNSEFVTTRLTNWTLAERTLRVRIPFGVAYGSDKELVKQAALEATAEVPYTLTHMKGREPDVWLTEYGDNSLNFLLLVWVNRQGARRPTRTRSAYLWALETKLNEYGIEIPFPQRDLHLRSGWPAAARSES